MKILVTGGAGFIGTSVVRHLLADGRERGQSRQAHLCRLEPAVGRTCADGRYALEVADIADGAAVARIFARAPARCGDASRGRDPCRPLDRRARRFHRRPTSSAPSPARGGARLLAGARRRRRGRAFASTTSRPTRCSARWDADGQLHRGRRPIARTAPMPPVQGRRRPSGARLASHLWPAGDHHQLLQQLRAVAVSGKAHPADDPQRARRQAAAGLRRRRAMCATGSMSSDHAAALWLVLAGRPVGETYNIGGGEERTNLDAGAHALRHSRRGAAAVAASAARAS